MISLSVFSLHLCLSNISFVLGSALDDDPPCYCLRCIVMFWKHLVRFVHEDNPLLACPEPCANRLLLSRPLVLSPLSSCLARPPKRPEAERELYGTRKSFCN